VRAAGATGPLVCRADSGFYSHGVVDACRKANVRFSITAKVQKKGGVRKAIAAIDESDWVAIPYFLDGADVAETTYQPFGSKADPVVSSCAEYGPRQAASCRCSQSSPTTPLSPTEPVRCSSSKPITDATPRSRTPSEI